MLTGTEREALGIEKPTDILDHINSLPGSAKEEAQEKIRAIERRAMALQRPQPGLTQLMDYLDRRGVRKAICTRNFEYASFPVLTEDPSGRCERADLVCSRLMEDCSEPINHLLTTFIPHSKFHPIVTRAFHPPKPNPAGILHICQQMGLEEADRGDGMVMVGDSIDDMAASAGAGSTAVLLVNAENEHLGNHEHTDVCISRYMVHSLVEP